jgi:L-ribulokinase
MGSDAFVIGVDFGTDSVRSIIVNTRNGKEVSSSVFHYPRWRDGLFCNPVKSQFRQHPLDYTEGLEFTVNDCIQKAGSFVIKNISALSIDTTGSSPVAVDKTGTPLALQGHFANNPNAMFVLWKDHSSTREAAEINMHAARYPVNYLKYVGGIYSSEWFWAKLLHVLRLDEEVRKACYSWVEHCDWIPFMLTGGTDVHQMKRGVCGAGHKALWAAEFGGLPPGDFFSALDPLLTGFRERLFNEVFTSDKAVGTLSHEWSRRLGLSTEVIVGVGAFDAHMGAVGGQIEPYHLCKVMGTSTCDMLVVPPGDMQEKLVKGICGQVDGSIIPGMLGLEAGQSAFGDTFAWVKNLLEWPIQSLLSQSACLAPGLVSRLRVELGEKIIPELSKQAAGLPLDEESELAIDWLNGRRTPDANQTLKGAMFGLDLGTSAPHFFRAWVEATCFGAKAIVERMRDEGVAIKGLIGLGGVARKSPYIMQLMADVMNMPIRIHRSEQTCASGAAMFAATAAGLYPKVEDAMAEMGQGFDFEYCPAKSSVEHYRVRYEKYLRAGTFVENQKEPIVLRGY